MIHYALRRLLWLPVILFGVSAIAFFLLRGLPGQNPADVIAGQGATPDQVARIRADLGLERPLLAQYGEWIDELARGDFGREYRSGGGGQNDGKPIRGEFVRRFPPTFQLLVLSLAISGVVGIGFGIISSLWRNSPFDYFVRTFAVLAASVPEFFLLALLIIVPLYLWGYSQPTGGYVPIYEDLWTNLRLLGPAAVIIGIGGSAGLMRLTRTTMLEVLRADYVRTAHAKGLPGPTVVLGHALRNSMTPLVTALGSAFVGIASGSIVAENVLSIQGLGQWFFTAATFRDLPVVQFLVVYTAAVVVLTNLVVDLSYGFIDPRVRYS